MIHLVFLVESFSILLNEFPNKLWRTLSGFFGTWSLSFSLELQKQVLLFTTGSDRVPIGGMSEMQFRISRVDNLNMWVCIFVATLTKVWRILLTYNIVNIVIFPSKFNSSEHVIINKFLILKMLPGTTEGQNYLNPQ